MNLIITSNRHLEEEAADEILKILEDFGDTNPKITISKLSGIVTVSTLLDPFFVVKKIRERILDEPWSIRYCLRVIPIQETVITKKENIVNAVLDHKHILESDNTYRITIEKRNSSVSTKEIIDAIANKIENKVSLEKFDWLILIEILGIETGVSILKESDVLSMQKLKRSLSD